MNILPKVTILSVLLLNGCAKNFDPSYDIDPITENSVEAVFDRDVIDFKVIAEEAENSPNADSIYNYLDSGITLSNLACNIWFDTLFFQGKNLDVAQRNMNIFGDGALGIVGLIGRASAETMGVVATALGASNATFDNFNTNFRLSNTLETVYDKLKEARGEFANKLLTFDQWTFPAAQRSLREYHGSCSRISVTNFIEESVDLAKFELQDFSKPFARPSIPKTKETATDGTTKPADKSGKNESAEIVAPMFDGIQPANPLEVAPQEQRRGSPNVGIRVVPQ